MNNIKYLMYFNYDKEFHYKVPMCLADYDWDNLYNELGYSRTYAVMYY